MRWVGLHMFQILALVFYIPAPRGLVHWCQVVTDQVGCPLRSAPRQGRGVMHCQLHVDVATLIEPFARGRCQGVCILHVQPRCSSQWLEGPSPSRPRLDFQHAFWRAGAARARPDLNGRDTHRNCASNAGLHSSCATACHRPRLAWIGAGKSCRHRLSYRSAHHFWWKTMRKPECRLAAGSHKAMPDTPDAQCDEAR